MLAPDEAAPMQPRSGPLLAHMRSAQPPLRALGERLQWGARAHRAHTRIVYMFGAPRDLAGVQGL